MPHTVNAPLVGQGSPPLPSCHHSLAVPPALSGAGLPYAVTFPACGEQTLCTIKVTIIHTLTRSPWTSTPLRLLTCCRFTPLMTRLHDLPSRTPCTSCDAGKLITYGGYGDEEAALVRIDISSRRVGSVHSSGCAPTTRDSHSVTPFGAPFQFVLRFKCCHLDGSEGTIALSWI